MVRRSESVTGAPKGRRSGGKPARGRRDGEEEWQQPGALMLTNPLIPPEMDEDIDDDLAFNSEDERMYGEFFAEKAASKPRQPKTKKRLAARRPGGGDDDDDDDDDAAAGGHTRRLKSKGRDVKTKGGRRTTAAAGDDGDGLDNYHEDGQSSGDDEDYIDLSDMLDMSLKEERKKKQAKAKKATRVTETGAKVAKKRRASQQTDEQESMLGLADASASGGASSYTDAMRLIMRQKGASAGGDVEAVTGRIKRSLQSKHNLVAVDADDMTKDRLTRREVRAIVGEEMERYKPVLKELDSAKHIQFPMHLPDSSPVASSVGGIVAAADAQFRGDRAVTPAQASSAAYRVGSKIDALLSKAGLSRRQVGDGADTPNSIGNHVRFDDGDAAASLRRADEEAGEEAPTTGYMAKLKAMLSYENSRRKRLNKIKSKTYRRILRKEKDREKERRQKAFELLHPELARQQLAERLLKTRAEERVTQKHKNTSAWVKHAKRFAQFDENTKDAIDDQHATHQRLMQKMEQDAGEENYARYMAGDNESEASSEEDRAVDALIAKVGASGGAPLSRQDVKSILWSSVDAADNEEGGATDSTAGPMAKARAELREMKFMKNAREREEKGYEDQLEALRRDIEAHQRQERAGSEAGSEEAEGGARAAAQSSGSVAALPSAAAGRAVFKTGKGAGAVEQVHLRRQGGIRAQAADEGDDDDDDEDGGASAEAEVDSVGSASSDEEKEEPRRRSNAERRKATAPAPPVSAASEFAGTRKDAVQQRAVATRKATSTRVTILPQKRARAEEEEEAAPPADTAVESADVPEEDLRLHQEYLISRAFAHDDVDEDFVKEKEAQVETIMRPEDKNQSLPGWGEWGGEDPELNKRHQETVQHLTAQRQIQKSFLMKSRADAALEHVIINHDGVELVPDRMTLHMVPRPFSNPQEFARSMRQPMGPEWTSALSFKDGVQPRVEVRQGQALLPLDLSLRKPKTKTKRRKTEAGATRKA
ncbi:Utp14 protein [Novymonas esmeraldas]|uniref:Utp14 protein n=1 Tax=Novymonas esmeraldas TaxID=1808958 RepID=A0AAW0F099_9TRYP